MSLKIAVILGSVRKERKGIRAAKFIVDHLEKREHEVHFIDPVVEVLPLLDKRYSDYEPGEKIPDTLESLHKTFEECDAFIVVSAEYNHSIPPALSNLLDYFYDEFKFKPSAIVCYSGGNFGGVRVAMQLVQFLAELQMPAIPTVFPITRIVDSFDESGKPKDEKYNSRVKYFLDELEFYAFALKKARASGIPEED